MSDLFLSDKEVEDMTGYERPSKQILRLRKSGVRFFVRADGRPRVPRVCVTKTIENNRTEPDVEALRLLLRKRRR